MGCISSKKELPAWLIWDVLNKMKVKRDEIEMDLMWNSWKKTLERKMKERKLQRLEERA